jgi:hypothetical protein
VVKQDLEFRKLKSIDHGDMDSDLKILVDKLSTSENFETLIDNWNGGLSDLLNQHAPLVTKRITCRNRPIWITDMLLTFKAVVRRAEKRYRRDPTFINKGTLKELRQIYRKQVKHLKWEHVNSAIQECGNDAQKLYTVVNKLTGRQKVSALPDEENSSVLADKFAEFFMSKIHKIRNNLKDYPLFDPPIRQCTQLSAFRSFNEEAISKLVSKTKSTICETDPFPASLLKQHLPTMLPVLTRIINDSLTTGKFSRHWKTSIVRPLLKKPSLDVADLSNYRPVNNLPFVSKVVERGMLAQLNDHLTEQGLLPGYISAYRESYSTETALIKVVNDLLINIDHQKVTPLIALDLSAAFDTVDHGVLLEVLHNQFGICDTALEWFRSYLNDRTIKVQIQESFSAELELPFSVPQGSCAGPVAYNLYASTLQNYIHTHLPDELGDVSILGYADDHACYIPFKAGKVEEEKCSVGTLEQCAKIIAVWMNENRLKLNTSKTEYIKFGNQCQIKKCSVYGIDINGDHITESQSIKYLGVLLDEGLNFKKHINSKCQTAMYNLFRLKSIRSYLSRKSMEQLVQSLVVSHIDYCSTLLYGLPKTTLAKLQRVQSFAAKLILNKRKYDSVTQCLLQLHWLPVEYRILFRLLCMCYKCVNGQAPDYLCCYFKRKETLRSLRSAQNDLYVVPRTKTKSFGDRAFSVSGPKEWNRLPAEIKDCDNLVLFKKQLKTYLFQKAFNM